MYGAKGEGRSQTNGNMGRQSRDDKVMAYIHIPLQQTDYQHNLHSTRDIGHGSAGGGAIEKNAVWNSSNVT